MTMSARVMAWSEEQADAETAHLAFRCILRADRREPGTWVGRCVDLGLQISAPTLRVAKQRLEDAIECEVESMLVSAKREGLMRILTRPVPIKERLCWRLLVLRAAFLGKLGSLRMGFAFESILPVRLITAD